MVEYFTGFTLAGVSNLGFAFAINIVRHGEVAYLSPVDGHHGNIPAIKNAGVEVTAEGLLTGTHKLETAALDDAMGKVKDVVITTVADGHLDLILDFAQKYNLSAK